MPFLALSKSIDAPKVSPKSASDTIGCPLIVTVCKLHAATSVANKASNTANIANLRITLPPFGKGVTIICSIRGLLHPPEPHAEKPRR